MNEYDGWIDDLEPKKKIQREPRRSKLDCTCKFCGKKYIPLCLRRICRSCRQNRRQLREEKRKEKKQ